MSEKESKSGIVLTTSGMRAKTLGLLAAGALALPAAQTAVQHSGDALRVAGQGAEAVPGLVASGAKTVAGAATEAGAATDRFMSGEESKASEYKSFADGAMPDGADVTGFRAMQAQQSGDPQGDTDAPLLTTKEP